MPKDNLPSTEMSANAEPSAANAPASDALAILRQTQIQLEKALLAAGVAERAAQTIVLQARANERPTLQYGLAATDAKSLSNKTIALHVGDGFGADFHIDLWLEHMQCGGREVLVIVRSQYVFNSIKERTDFDSVFVREGRDAETLLSQCQNLKAILYASNTGNTIQFLRHNHLTHVFVGHGDSEKASSCHKYFRVYDEVWTAGQAHIDRFKNSGVDFHGVKFIAVGRPALRAVLDGDHKATFDQFLYLPTWEGFHNEQNYSSIKLGVDFLKDVASATGKRAVIKFHPLTGKQDETLADSEALYSASLSPEAAEVLDRSVSAVKAMENVDFLIADVSSVVTDFLPTQKPIFLFASDDDALRIASSNMPYAEYCYKFSDSETLSRLITSVIINGNDPLKGRRLEALNYFIDVRATETNAFARELDRVSAGG